MIRVFRHYISPIKLALVGTDFILLMVVALAAMHFDFQNFQFMPSVGFVSILAGIIYAGIIVSGTLAVGCYASDSVRSFRNFIIRFCLVLMIASLIYAGILYFLDLHLIHRNQLFIAIGLSLLFVPFIRWVILSFVAEISLKLKIVLVGGNQRCFEIREIVKQAKEIGVEVVAIVCLTKEQMEGHMDDPDAFLYDDIPDVAAFVQSKGAETIIAMSNTRNNDKVLEDLIACKLEGIHIHDLTSFYEQALGYVDIDSLREEWIVFADGFHGGSIFENWLKRISDISVSLLVLLLASPLMILAAFLVKLTSKGPVFYVQERVGYKGKTFNLIKFRTMTVTAEQGGPQWAQENDPRVTPVGRFLRRSRIDELTQIINVLKGDMSFVGPRPERPFFVDQFVKNIPFYKERHYVKPGITGWAQLRYPYGASEEDAKRKLEYDLYYLKNYSIFLDVLIILQTVRVVLFPSGVR